MAAKVGQVIAIWEDAAGKVTRSKFNVPVVIAEGELEIGDVEDKAKLVLTAMEKLTKLKWIEATLVVALDTNGHGGKANPLDNSSIFEEAYIEFLSELGDSEKRTMCRLFIPSPKDAVLTDNGTKIDKSVSAIVDLIATAKDKILTQDGRALFADGDTNVRQRVTRK